MNTYTITVERNRRIRGLTFEMPIPAEASFLHMLAPIAQQLAHTLGLERYEIEINEQGGVIRSTGDTDLNTIPFTIRSNA